jgi:flavin-dependent thymidylate synthase
MTQSKELQQWVDPAMFRSEPMPETEGGVSPKVYLLSATPDPLGAIAAASKMYKGEVVRSLMDVTDEERRHFWIESQKTHLRAPHEYVDFHFMIEGVTRSFTHQLVRQRTAVYSQESLRFAVKEGFADEVPLPPSLIGLDREDTTDIQLWEETVETIEHAYERLVAGGMPAEDARGLLPHSITTRVHYKTNLLGLVHHAGNRLCTQAQFEWRFVFNEIVRAIREYDSYGTLWNKWQFEEIADSNLFRPVCYAQGKCPFNADFDRDCTIRPRVEEGKFDEIETSEWLLDPAAARRGVG